MKSHEYLIKGVEIIKVKFICFKLQQSIFFISIIKRIKLLFSIIINLDYYNNTFGLLIFIIIL